MWKWKEMMILLKAKRKFKKMNLIRIMTVSLLKQNLYRNHFIVIIYCLKAFIVYQLNKFLNNMMYYNCSSVHYYLIITCDHLLTICLE